MNLLKTANRYYRNKDYVKAFLYYKLARDTYPFGFIDTNLEECLKKINSEDFRGTTGFKIAIKTPAPIKHRESWGDYHYAISLQRSLVALGHSVNVHCAEEWYGDENEIVEVVIVLRGLKKYRPKAHQLNIMWNISHPDKILYNEYCLYDIIYIASLSYTKLLTHILPECNIRPLLQATDTSIEVQNTETKDKLLFIGNSRNIYREIVKWAVESNFDIDIYGKLWERFIPQKFIKNTYVPNSVIKNYYRAYKTVLNDHWESMRHFGFISNRVYDVLSAGGTLVTDYIESIRTLFGNHVHMVKCKAELVKKIHHIDISKKDHNNIVDFVNKNHSFSHRAKAITDDMRNFIHLSSLYTKTMQKLGHKKSIKISLIVERMKGHLSHSAYIRLVLPLTTEGISSKVDINIVKEDYTTAALPQSDIIIVQNRAIKTPHEADALLRYLERHSVKLIIDLDDPYLFTASDRDTQDIRALHILIKAADSVWFSTEALQERCVFSNKNSVVLPSNIDTRIWKRYYQITDTKTSPKSVMKMLYISKGHEDNFTLVVSALDQLYIRFPGTFSVDMVESSLSGIERDWLKHVIIPSSCISYPKYAEWIGTFQQYDIGLIPMVVDTPSAPEADKQLLEFLALNILPLVSSSGTYPEQNTEIHALSVRDCDWYETLEHILKDFPSIYNERAKRSRKYLSKYRSVESLAARYYQSLVRAMEA